MKSLINFSLRNKFAIWLLTIIIVFAGLYSGLTMKQETLPNISIPYLSVTTIYPGLHQKASLMTSVNRWSKSYAMWMV